MKSFAVPSRIKPVWPIVPRFRLFTVTALLMATIVTLMLHPLSIQAQTAVIAPVQAPPNLPTNAVLDWNSTALAVTQAAAAPAPQQYRTLAIAHAAIFDAVNAIEHRYTPYAVDIKAPAGTPAEVAAAAAGHEVLVRLYPAQQSTLDAALSASLAKVPEGRSKADGIRIGKEVAQKLLVLRSQDGADRKPDYKVEPKVGVWQPTLPGFSPPLLPHWGTVTPFALKGLDQFQAPEPLPLQSAAYIEELNEVKRLGGRNSSARTADQTAAALFSPIAPAVLWNTTARAAATEKRLNLLENARLFALLNISGVDAYIAGYDVKYKYKLWRPVTAIRNADALTNPALTADPSWEPLIVTPAHPDYISGHCVSAGAEQRILQNFFGSDAVKINIIFPANVGVTRTFTSFSQICKELEDARVWGGVHTRTADLRGTILGQQVGNDVFANILLPSKD
jgi:PAP2 superfamily